MYCYVGSQRMFYTVKGHGQPLVILHGGLGLDHRYLDHWMMPLANHFQLFFLDMPGNGRSSKPTKKHPLSIESLIDAVEEFRRQIIRKPVYLLGHSYGGLLTALHMLRYPRAIKKALCISSPFFPLCSDLEAIEREKQKVIKRQMGRLPTCWLKTNAQFQDYMEYFFPIYFHSPTSFDSFTTHNRTLYHLKAFEIGHAQRLVKLERYCQLYSKITKPILVISGLFDIMVTSQTAKKFKQMLPLATVKYYKKSGHFPFVEEPERFINDITAFLR